MAKKKKAADMKGAGHECRPLARGSKVGKSGAFRPATKARALKRMRRVEGQVRGITAMIEQERHCADIMEQVAAVHSALRSVTREVMLEHLRHCARKAAGSRPKEAEGIYAELVELMYRNVR